jgi:hypothetical protein
MANDEPLGETQPSADDGVDPGPFFRRCDELSKQWGGLREHALRRGNNANVADLLARIAGFVFAAAAATVSTLVAAKVTGDVLTSTTSAFLAALATVATGIQASGMFRNRARHHYERMDVYREVRAKVRNLKAQVESKSITVGAGFEKLDELVAKASTRPEMP